MKHTYLLAGLLAVYLPGALAVDFNPEALKAMQDKGKQIVQEAKAAEETKAMRPFVLPGGKCLHVAGNPTKPGANLVIQNCNPEVVRQKWRFDEQGRLVNPAGLCVGVQGDPNKPGANAILQNCGPQAFQRWTRDDKNRMKNNRNKCLHAVGNANTPGGNVVTTNCNKAPNQVWN